MREPERRVDADQKITKVLGDEGFGASSGEGVPSRIFPVNSPQGLACDSQNNLFVTSATTVRLVTAIEDGSGQAFVDGVGDVQGFLGPEFPLRCLTGISVIDDTTVWATDSYTGSLVELTKRPGQAP